MNQYVLWNVVSAHSRVRHDRQRHFFNARAWNCLISNCRLKSGGRNGQDGQLRHRAKFRGDRSNRCGDMARFLFFQDGGHLEPRFQGGRGRPWEIFFGFYKTWHILLWHCKLHRATCRRFDTILACDRLTDRQTDGIAVASTALAMPALRRAVKMGVVLIKHRSDSQWTVLLGHLTISTHVKCYYRVVYNNFVFQQNSAPGASCIQHSPTVAVQNSQLPFSCAMAQ